MQCHEDLLDSPGNKDTKWNIRRGNKLGKGRHNLEIREGPCEGHRKPTVGIMMETNKWVSRTVPDRKMSLINVSQANKGKTYKRNKTKVTSPAG